MDLDRNVARAIYGAVGGLQTEMHELDPQFVSEADLKRTVRRALQMQLGPSVLPEGARSFRLEDWPGRLMSPEILIRHPTEAGQRAFVELKWCREDKMFEVLWDLLKLSLAGSLDGVEATYLIVGAPGRAWSDPGWTCSALLSNDEWSTRDLFSRYERAWSSLLAGNKTARPIRLPAAVGTDLLVALPIHLLDIEDWELRAARVQDLARGWVQCQDGWPQADK